MSCEFQMIALQFVKFISITPGCIFKQLMFEKTINPEPWMHGRKFSMFEIVAKKLLDHVQIPCTRYKVLTTKC